MVAGFWILVCGPMLAVFLAFAAVLACSYITSFCHAMAVKEERLIEECINGEVHCRDMIVESPIYARWVGEYMVDRKEARARADFWWRIATLGRFASV